MSVIVQYNNRCFHYSFIFDMHNFNFPQIICNHLMQEFSNTSYKRTEPEVEKQLLVTLTYLGTVQSYKYELLLSIINIIYTMLQFSAFNAVYILYTENT